MEGRELTFLEHLVWEKNRIFTSFLIPKQSWGKDISCVLVLQMKGQGSEGLMYTMSCNLNPNLFNSCVLFPELLFSMSCYSNKIPNYMMKICGKVCAASYVTRLLNHGSEG